MFPLPPIRHSGLLVFLCFFFALPGDSAFALQDIKTLRPSTSADASSLDPALAQSKSLVDQGKAVEAEPLLRGYLENHPNSASAHFLLGLDLFRQIQEKTRGPADAVPSQSAVGPDTITSARASLAEFTSGARFGKPTAFDLEIVALDYILLGDYPDADKWLTKMLEWTPNDPEGWYYLGRTKYNENRFEEAVSAFQQSLKLDPKNVKTEDNLGLSYAGLGRDTDALAAFHTAIEWQIELPAKNSRPFIDVADLLLNQNRTDEAIPYLHEAIQIAPQDSQAHELLGKACARLSRFPEAQAELETATALAPKNANLPCMLGPIYRKQGLADQAQAAFRRCAALNGTHSSAEMPRP